MGNYNIYIERSIKAQQEANDGIGSDMHGVYFNLKECKKIARDLVAKGAHAVRIQDNDFKSRHITLNSAVKKWWDTRNCPDSWARA
jgi:hypothetical protein